MELRVKALEKFSTKGTSHEEQGEKVGKNILSIEPCNQNLGAVKCIWKL